MRSGFAKRGLTTAVAAITAVCLVPGLGTATDASARATSTPAAPDSDRRVASGWIAYWRLADGLESTLANASLFGDVSLYWFSVTSDSTVVEQEPGAQPSSTVLQDSVDALQAEGIRAFLTVNDDGFNATSMYRLLKDGDRRDELVDSLVSKAQEFDAAGIDIDFESMNFGSVGAHRTGIKRLFPKFLNQLRDSLHQHDLKLALSLPPRTGPNDSNWEVYDYNAIAPTIDRVRVMAYDYHYMGGSPGAIAPLPWVDDVARFAANKFGRKLSLGIPAYGYNWHIKRLVGECPPGATNPTSGTTRAFAELAEDRGATPRFVESVAGYTYRYRRTWTDGTNTCKVEREVWYEDSRSVEAKIRLLKRYHIKSFGIWTLGSERQRTWTVLRDYATSIRPADAHASSGEPAPITFGESADVFTRFIAYGQPVVNGEVNVYRRVVGGTWKKVATLFTDQNGRATHPTSPSRTWEYRMRLLDGWDWRGTSTSAIRQVVRHQVIGGFTDPTVPLGDSFVWTGSIGPVEAGVSVTLQRLKDGHWNDRMISTTAADGSYVFSGALQSTGSFTYRVRSGGDGLHASGLSDPANLIVQ